MNGTIRNRKPNGKNSIDIGYIILPPNLTQTRENYIAYCYRSNMVSVYTENQSFYNNVLIDNDKLQQIVFPDTDKHSDGRLNLGSKIVIVNEPVNNTSIIIGVLAKTGTSDFHTENKFRLQRKLKNNLVEITGNGNDGSLFLKVESSEPEGGQIHINISNDSNSGKLNVNVRGDMNLYTTGDLSINATHNIKLKVSNADESINTSLLIEGATLKINEGTQPIPLGTTLQSELTKVKAILDVILNIINGIAVPTSPVAATDAMQIALKAALVGLTNGDFSQINSEISFTD